MCMKDKHCDTHISLHSVGIQSQGCLKDNQWLQSINIPSYQSIEHPNIYVDLPTVKITHIRNVAHGQFGYIDLALYETADSSKEIYIKRPIIHGYSLLREACVQKLVGDNLGKIGYRNSAPTVVSIFKLRNGSICFGMEQIEGACTLDKYLESVPSNQISNVIIDCLLQLCGMKTFLTNTLGMNHRDLKPSNCLIVERNTAETRFITVENEVIEILTKRSITLIDFGFACIGSPITHQSYLSLSTVYPKLDPCPKEGRDMYVFIGLLYIDYHMKLPPNLVALFESWLEVPGSNLCTLMRKDNENSKKWLYFMAGNEQILSFNSCPKRIIRDLTRMFIAC